MEESQSTRAAVNRIVKAIVDKLMANEAILAKCQRGHVKFRKRKNGEIEIRLELNV